MSSTPHQTVAGLMSLAEWDARVFARLLAGVRVLHSPMVDFGYEESLLTIKVKLPRAWGFVMWLRLDSRGLSRWAAICNCGRTLSLAGPDHRRVAKARVLCEYECDAAEFNELREEWGEYSSSTCSFSEFSEISDQEILLGRILVRSVGPLEALLANNLIRLDLGVLEENWKELFSEQTLLNLPHVGESQADLEARGEWHRD